MTFDPTDGSGVSDRIDTPAVPTSVVALLRVSDRPAPNKRFSAGFRRQEDRDIPRLIYPGMDDPDTAFSHDEAVALVRDGVFGELAWAAKDGSVFAVCDHAWRALWEFYKSAGPAWRKHQEQPGPRTLTKYWKASDSAWEKYQERFAEITRHCSTLEERDRRIEAKQWHRSVKGNLVRGNGRDRLSVVVFPRKDGSGWAYLITDRGPGWWRHYQHWQYGMDYKTRPKYPLYPDELKHWSNDAYFGEEIAQTVAIGHLNRIVSDIVKAEEEPAPEGLEDIW